MSDADKQAMEDALQAAVAKMHSNGANGANGGSTPNGSGLADPISLVMSLLPRLLQNKEAQEDVAEKIDGLRTEDMAAMAEQIRLMRRQLHRVHKTQQMMCKQLAMMQEQQGELQEQQTACGEVTLHLVQQMARLEVVEDDDSEPSELDEGSFVTTTLAGNYDADEFEDDEDDGALGISPTAVLARRPPSRDRQKARHKPRKNKPMRAPRGRK